MVCREQVASGAFPFPVLGECHWTTSQRERFPPQRAARAGNACLHCPISALGVHSRENCDVLSVDLSIKHISAFKELFYTGNCRREVIFRMSSHKISRENWRRYLGNAWCSRLDTWQARSSAHLCVHPRSISLKSVLCPSRDFLSDQHPRWKGWPPGQVNSAPHLPRRVTAPRPHMGTDLKTTIHFLTCNVTHSETGYSII